MIARSIVLLYHIRLVLKTFLSCRNMKRTIHAAECGSVSLPFSLLIWLCAQELSPDVWGKTGVCRFIRGSLHCSASSVTAQLLAVEQIRIYVLSFKQQCVQWNETNSHMRGCFLCTEKRPEVWDDIREGLEISKGSQAKPIARTLPCSGGQGRWPAVEWWRKCPGQWNLCRALRLPHPITAEPLRAFGTYTPFLDTPALNGSSRRWTGSPLRSHTCGRDTNTETNS